MLDPRHSNFRLLSTALPLLLAAGTLAQAPHHEPPSAPSPPSQTQPVPIEHAPPPAPPEETEINRSIRELEAAARRTAPISPANLPAGARPRSTDHSGRLVREGTFLVDRRGRVVRAANGELLYHFDPDAAGKAEPPMPLLPCQYLEGLVAAATRGGDPVAFKISGQVLAYHGRNYLLLSRPAEVLRTAPAPLTPAPKPPAPSDSTTTPATQTHPTDAQRTISELEAAAPVPAAVVALPTAIAASAESARAAAPYREGTFIASRRGRVTKTAGGWMLAFDNDPQSQGDPPIQLLPCVNLMAMEDLAIRAGDAVSIAVSGPVYAYQGRSFLLPTMYVVQPRAQR